MSNFRGAVQAGGFLKTANRSAGVCLVDRAARGGGRSVASGRTCNGRALAAIGIGAAGPTDALRVCGAGADMPRAVVLVAVPAPVPAPPEPPVPPVPVPPPMPGANVEVAKPSAKALTFGSFIMDCFLSFPRGFMPTKRRTPGCIE